MLKRILQLRAQMKTDGVEGLLVARDSDVRYLSGEKFEAGSTLLYITCEKQYILTDGRFANQLAQDDTGFLPVIYDPARGLFGEAAALIQSSGLKKIATEYAAVSHADFSVLSAGGITAADAAPYLARLRMVKDADELALIRKACAITDASFEAVLGTIRPGITERDVANALEYEFKKRGGDGLAFETIVASGPVNGASCHAVVTGRVLEAGDSVTMDFGTTYEGYCSDITRTVFLGKASDEQKKIYGIVAEAKKRAAEALHAGVPLKEIAATCVGYVESCGYSVPHGVGHSFGYDIHEPLFISIRDARTLGADMVTTLEPGIYIPGVGGVRIEDDYRILPDGAEQLTHCTERLLEL